jgi:hypothetical protein
MNGGGGVCQSAGNYSAALEAAEEVFSVMATNGTEKVVYVFNPDPIGTNWEALKNCLDGLRQELKSVCDMSTNLECIFVDLRETWEGHADYTEDGLHPISPGAAATAGVVWEAMQEHCVAQ